VWQIPAKPDAIRRPDLLVATSFSIFSFDTRDIAAGRRPRYTLFDPSEDQAFAEVSPVDPVGIKVERIGPNVSRVYSESAIEPDGRLGIRPVKDIVGLDAEQPPTPTVRPRG
jgi:hypothetical protein